MNFITVFKSKETCGAALLITGCCIGAGMIGLPVMSALAGFIPSSLAMVLCYLFTTATGLLLLEATLWFDGEVNLPSIVERMLGKVGKFVTLILFTSLFYCLFVAYLDGLGLLFADILSAVLHQAISREIGIFACLFFVGSITYAGTKIVDGLNRGLLLGLITSYFTLLLIGLPNINKANLSYVNWTSTLATIPILLICFGYHNLVPSITYYLKRNVNAIRYAIIIGNLIPFIIYILWNIVILGMLSMAEPTVSTNDVIVTELLQNASSSLSIVIIVKVFSIMAMLTSFLPSAVSFVDFLKDGLKIKFQKQQTNTLLLYGLVFIPPLISALFYPHIFLQALGFAGGFIDVLLFGILPATVILIGRNVRKMNGPYQVVGGNVTPLIILALSFLILFIKVA